MKKVVNFLVIIAVMLSMAVPAYGQETVTSFSDVKPGQWFYEYVMTLTGKGVITGVTKPVNGVGKYDPQGTVTLGQFLAIATRLVASEYIKEVPNPRHWAEPNYNAAVESGLIGKGDFGNSPAYLNTPISREDMAYILVNMAKLNGETLEIKSGIKNNIGDYGQISVIRREAVEKAYSNGLLVGDDQGNFNPKKPLTRAEVAAVFCRVMNYTARPEVVVKAPGSTGTGTKKREPMVLRWDDPDRPLPQAGDTFIDKNGKATVLTETVGVVGYGQGLDLYSGMKYGDRTLQHGDIGDVWHGDKTYLGQPYWVDKKTGEGHFRSDWEIISSYEAELTLDVRNPKDGQRVGYWTVYFEELGGWYWTGPR
ncbi:MAG TPA: S-layer homology domain-containing protein [Clostridiales bacterium]|nr:S-layer homology domain-containing protein [Clostridiales bacterium]HQD31955.1 S-layer homology domain-containing protein [Clostridiales bacterium]